VTAPHIFVRQAGTSDREKILKHQELSRHESSKYRGTPYQAIVDGEELSLVSGVGDTVFGSLRSVFTSPTSCRIDLVFVEETAREIGIADAMLQHLIRHCQALGVTWIAASAQPGDRAMKNLFERHGLVAQTILVGKSLSDLSTEEHASQ